MTDLQAGVGLGQLEALSWRMQRLTRTHQIYAEKLSDVPGVALLPFAIEKGELPLWTDAIIEKRDELVSNLAQNGMECRKFWHPLHTQAPYYGNDSDFPVATEKSKKAVWLPSALTLTDSDVAMISRQIRDCL